MKKSILKRFDLTGKVVAITGGGGELCGAMAEALGGAGREGGCPRYRLGKSRSSVGDGHRVGGSAKAFRCDVLDTGQVRECYEAVCSLWGPPDFLINGAGGNHPRGTTSEEFHGPRDRPVRQLNRFLIWIRPGFDRCLTSIS